MRFFAFTIFALIALAVASPLPDDPQPNVTPPQPNAPPQSPVKVI